MSGALRKKLWAFLFRVVGHFHNTHRISFINPQMFLTLFSLNQTTISKEEVGLDLPELEMAAELVLQEEEERKKMKKKMVRVNECDDDTDDEFESSSDSDDEIDEKGETDEEDDDDDEEEKVNKETLSDGSCVGRCDTSRQHEVDKCAHEMTRLNL